jgi:hypothetical protein
MPDNYRTIGGLKSALVDLDPTSRVYVDNKPPTALSSYRGYYDHLAIECSERQNETTAIDKPHPPFNSSFFGRYTPGSHEVAIKTPPTVSDLIEALDLADGATFEGYKGGQFTMNYGTDLWVSEYGQCSRRRISGIEQFDGRVDLLTIEEEW